MLDIVLDALVVFMDGCDLLFILIEFKFVIILDCFHIFCVFKIENQFLLNLLDDFFFVLKFLPEILFLFLVFLLILFELIDLHLGFEDEIFEVIPAILEIIDGFLFFGVLS